MPRPAPRMGVAVLDVAWQLTCMFPPLPLEREIEIDLGVRVQDVGIEGTRLGSATPEESS